MKTSNKLLFGYSLLFFVSLLFGLIVLKANVVITTLDSILALGDEITEVVLDSYESDHFKLEGDFVYSLDPNSENISVLTYENISSRVKVSEGKRLRFYTEGDLDVDRSKIKIIIGVKGKENINLDIKHKAKLELKKDVESMIYAKVEDNAIVELDGNFKSLELFISDNSIVSMSGSCNSMTLKAEEDSKFSGENLSVQNLDLRSELNASLSFKVVDTLKVEMRDFSLLKLEQDWKKATISELDENAQIIINDQPYIQ